MRIVFMGTPDFAVPSLRLLAQSHEVVGVYTRPDSASGRGAKMRPSPVKSVAEGLGLPVHQPVTLRDPVVLEQLAAARPDVCVVAAYGLILPAEVLAIPAHGCINVHASLLPRWRGAAPVQRAILAGDSVTGVSIMRMEEGLDTGPYCEVEQVEVGEKSATRLTDELAFAGAKALGRALDRLSRGVCEWVEQDESGVTYADKIHKADVALSPQLTVEQALRRVRASGASAPTRVSVAGRVVTIVTASLAQTPTQPGQAIADKTGLVLGFSDGSLQVSSVKPEGKREMDAAQWTCGLRVEQPCRWESL